MSKIKIRWQKEEFELEIPSTIAELTEVLEKATSVPGDRQKLLGVPGGKLTNVAQLKDGMKLTLLGTPAEKQLVTPVEKVRFVEDLTSEEVARLTKQRKVEERGSAGLANLGNTCYANSVVQVMASLDEFRDTVSGKLEEFPRNVEGTLARRLGEVMKEMKQATSEATVTPMGFLTALRARFPDFGRRDATGNFQQQDAEECWRGILEAVGGVMGQEKVDEFFGFDVRIPGKAGLERQRIMLCHLGTQTAVVNHLQEGLRLSLSDANAGTSEVANLPPYLTVQFARFAWKARSETAGTEATRTKVTRKCTFPKTLDLHDFLTAELKTKLAETRERRAQRKLEDAEAAAAAGEATGFYELKAIVSHQGRSAEGGHYVAWVRASKDVWLKFDDDIVSEVGDWTRLEQAGIQGGLADSQMAYFVVYQRETL